MERENRALSPFLVGVFAAEAAEGGHEDDLHVHPEGPVPDIGQVILDALLHLLNRIRFPAPAVHLRPAGDAGLHLVPEHVAGDQFPVVLVMGDGMGPGADDGHPPLKDVDELGQLIEGGFPQELPELRYPWIVPLRLGDVGAVLADRHGAEFPDKDFFPVEPVSSLLKDDRPGGGQLHADSDRDQDRQDHKGDDRPDDEVFQPLDPVVYAVEGPLVDADRGDAPHVHQPGVQQLEGEDVRDDVHGGRRVGQHPHDLLHPLFRAHGKGQIDKVDMLPLRVLSQVIESPFYGQLAPCDGFPLPSFEIVIESENFQPHPVVVSDDFRQADAQGTGAADHDGSHVASPSAVGAQKKAQAIPGNRQGEKARRDPAQKDAAEIRPGKFHQEGDHHHDEHRQQPGLQDEAAFLPEGRRPPRTIETALPGKDIKHDDRQDGKETEMGVPRKIIEGRRQHEAGDNDGRVATLVQDFQLRTVRLSKTSGQHDQTNSPSGSSLSQRRIPSSMSVW